MFSGGRQITQAERAELNRLSTLANQQNDTLTERSNASGDAYNVMGDARSDRGQADSDVEGSKNLVEAAQRASDENLHELQKIREDLKVTENNVSRLFEQANSQKWLYSEQVRRDYELGCLEAICDNINEGFECVRVMHAASMRLNAAMNEVRSGASVEFQPGNNMRPGSATRDTSEETYVQANSAKSDLDTQVARYNEKANDPFTANKLEDAQQRLSDDKAGLETAEAAESDAVRFYKNLRDARVAQARDELQRTQDAMRKIEDIQYEGNG